METPMVDPQVWYYNFKKGVSALLKEEIAAGYTVKAIVVSYKIAKKIEDAIGYEPNNILGYKLEILDEQEFVFEEDEDEQTRSDREGYLGFRSVPIN